MTKRKRTNRIAENKSIPQSAHVNNWFPILIFIMVGILVFYPPFFRGLFFSRDMFITYIITGLILLLVGIDKIRRRDYLFLTTPLDWAVLAYAGAYLLSLAGAVHIGEAFYGFLRALDFFVIYWIVTQVVKDYQGYERLMQVLIASGVGVALVGILAAAGHCNYPNAFDGKYIISTMQYRNATAAYLVVMSMLGITLWIKEKNPIIRLLYSLANYLMILMLLGTLSKGGWLAFILGSLLLIAGMPGKYRIRTIYILAVSGLAALITAVKFLPAIFTGKTSHVLLYLLLGLVVLCIGELLWKYFINHSRDWGKNMVVVGAVVLIGAIVGLGVYLRGPGASLYNNLQSSSLVSQFHKIGDFSDFSYTNRADMYRWGIAMAKDHLLTGTGAGGWNALYHQYQDYLFYATEVHDHFLQVLIETGLIGLLAFLAMWFMLVFIISRRRKRLGMEMAASEPDLAMEHWILNWGVAAGALTAGAHALIDFDLSLGAMCIMLWTLFALINAGSRIDQIQPLKKLPQGAFIAVGAVLVFLFLLSGSCMLSAINMYNRADYGLTQVKMMPSGAEKLAQLQVIEKMSARAQALDPFNSQYPALVAEAGAMQYDLLIKDHDPESAGKIPIVNEAIHSAEKLSPYDLEIRANLVNVCILIDDLPGAVEQVRQLLDANPYDANVYSLLIKLTVTAADDSLKKGNQSTAVDYLQEAIQTPAVMEGLKANINPQKMQPPFWTASPLTLSSEALFYLGKAYYMLGYYTEALSTLQPLLNTELDSNLSVAPWYWAAVQKTGAQAGYQKGIQQMQNRDPEAMARFNEILQLPVLK